ncbi:MAG TPA: VWA domain-containing protein [Bryobacteraceae bacterium]|nr:VWA domain-containing protein [Bryobacteraceae bacterium]
MISRRNLLVSTASLLASRALRGQQQPDATFSADVKVVNVLATVRNGKGDVVRDLTANDFSITEDSRPQTIRYFSRETDLPLTLGLLIDTSGSQRRVLPEERTASRRFFEQVLREDKDQAFLIHFEREVELLEDLTSSRQKLESALDSIDRPELQRRGTGGGYPGGGGRYPRGGGGGGRFGGGTALYDAVFLAGDEVLRKQKGRKAVIVLSDGVDNASKTSLTGAIEAAQRSDTIVYSILFADEQGYGGGGGGFPPVFGGGPGMGRRGGGGRRMPQEPRPDGRKILERISKETGGSLFEVSKKHPLEDIYSRIEEELRSQYNLGYTSDRTDSGTGYRKIQVTAKQKGLTVQARDGYYAGG